MPAPTKVSPSCTAGTLLTSEERAGAGPGPWRSGRHLRAVAAVHHRWQVSDADLRSAIGQARTAGDPWSLIAVVLHLDEREAVQRYGNRVP